MKIIIEGEQNRLELKYLEQNKSYANFAMGGKFTGLDLPEAYIAFSKNKLNGFHDEIMFMQRKGKGKFKLSGYTHRYFDETTHFVNSYDTGLTITICAEKLKRYIRYKTIITIERYPLEFADISPVYTETSTLKYDMDLYGDELKDVIERFYRLRELLKE